VNKPFVWGTLLGFGILFLVLIISPVVVHELQNYKIQDDYLSWNDREFQNLQNKYDALKKNYDATKDDKTIEDRTLQLNEMDKILDQQLDLLWQAQSCNLAKTNKQIQDQCLIPTPVL
jgi:hypothetical protein